jgi:hypothetical protein
LTFALTVVLALAGTPARADSEEGIPSFRKSTGKEQKSFVAKVGTAIVKAARSKPQQIELKSYEYTSPKANRSELKIVMTYKGVLTRVTYTSTMTVLIDTADKRAWEVLNIEYKDTNRSPAGPSIKSIQALIKKFNK